MKFTPLLAALCLSVTSSSFGSLADFAGKYKGTTNTTTTESTPPVYTEDVTFVVKPKGKGNAGTLILTSKSRVPGNEKMTTVVKLTRKGSGTAVVNNPGAGVVNLSIPINVKTNHKKFTVTSNFLEFGFFPTAVALNLKFRGKTFVGLLTLTRIETGAQVLTSKFKVKQKKS